MHYGESDLINNKDSEIISLFKNSSLGWVIEKAAKQSIAEIFEKDGEKAFRDLEKQVLKEISQHHSLVIASWCCWCSCKKV